MWKVIAFWSVKTMYKVAFITLKWSCLICDFELEFLSKQLLNPTSTTCMSLLKIDVPRKKRHLISFRRVDFSVCSCACQNHGIGGDISTMLLTLESHLIYHNHCEYSILDPLPLENGVNSIEYKATFSYTAQLGLFECS